MSRYGTSSNSNPDCGRQVEITNVANGKTTTAKVADACPGTFLALLFSPSLQKAYIRLYST